MSNIEWTGKTWNFLAGCSSRIEWRTSDVRLIQEALEIPLKCKKPTTYFVNSMPGSDVFHPSVLDKYIDAMMFVILMSPQHKFQLLTKHPKRMCEYFLWLELKRIFEAFFKFDSIFRRVVDDALLPFDGLWTLPASNLWLGTSVESQRVASVRIPYLFETPAAVRWLNMEPLLGPVNLTAVNDYDFPETEDPFNSLTDDIDESSYKDVRGEGKKLDWVVVGGESGCNARPFDIQWAHHLVSQCGAYDVPVFVKQLGENPVHNDSPFELKSKKR